MGSRFNGFEALGLVCLGGFCEFVDCLWFLAWCGVGIIYFLVVFCGLSWWCVALANAAVWGIWVCVCILWLA